MPLLLVILTLGLSCADRNDRPPDREPRTLRTEEGGSESARIAAPGLHNVYRVTADLFSGGNPEGEEGFRSLMGLGVKTVISVDGARPDVATAHKFGLRYVHLPFGYDGIPRYQVLRLARAVRDLPGPFYVHCHHGKHRGPAAAASIHLCMDEECSVERAVAEMKRAGTDPHYTGLYAVPKTLVRPTHAELDRVPADFPEVAEVPGMAQVMVEIDARWENLKLVRAAGWATPTDHADLDPAHEALQLVEQHREAGRLGRVEGRTGEFRRWMADAEDNVEALEGLLRAGRDDRRKDRPSSERAFRKVEESCAKCHAKYRNLPQEP